jgi:CBS domain containing-hemolysin-like protein
MASFIFGIFFAGLTLLAIGLLRTYNHYPVKELKRQARAGDPLATMLYRPVSYGLSLKVLLWSIVIGAAAISFVLLASSLEPWFAVLLIAVLLWVGFLWLPSAGLTSLSFQIAQWFTPIIDWLLNWLHPVLRRIADFIGKHRHVNFKTGLYEPEDLVALLERQRELPENRINKQQIDLLIHALTFTNKQVRDVLIPLRIVRLVNANESIGPALMDELYKSGFSRFPVFEGEQTNVIGTLFMRDLVRKQSRSTVRDVMRDDVLYIHEEYTLQQALQAFLKTKHHLFVVVNSFEEFVGILTIEDVLEQVIGKQIIDEFDAFDDVRAVAASAAAKEHAKRQKAAQEPTEVVE